MIINIKYPPDGAYILKDTLNKQISANPRENTTTINEKQKPIMGNKCGENRYEENMLEFYLTPNCSVWIENVDIIKANLRLNWTLKAFNDKGGVNTFVTMVS